jgi:hypothetical protein
VANHKKQFCLNNHDTNIVGRFGGQCRECRRNYQKIYNKSNAQKENVSRWHKANKEHVKDMEYRRTYGISLDDYKKMMIKQEGFCLICNEAKPLVVDHDHKTGKVRGLLCNNCNRALGYLKDNPNRLESAIVYLYRFSPVLSQSV